MGSGDESRKVHSTDDQETSVQGTPVPEAAKVGAASGTLLNNRYLLVRQLNAGGFGTVHLAHDQQMHGRPVVVKIQIQQRVDDPWFERKFSEEVRALSLLDHPGVVVAFDSGRTPEGMPFLVMQYVDGVTLRAVMTPEGMPIDRAAGILKQLGQALAAAHEKGIWHRDLKPENIMLQTSAGGEDRVRLIDFGIATVADVKSKYETSTRVAGSALYMAPEQHMGQPTALSDIYAMGLIAYEMVTGRRPFPAENAMQMITLQQLPVRVKPTDLRITLPGAAEQLILQSLAIDPASRPQSARAFGDQLHDALLGLGSAGPGIASAAAPVTSGVRTAPPPPPPPPPPQIAPARADARKSRRPWVLAIAGIAIVGGMISDWRKPKRLAQPPTPAISEPSEPDTGSSDDAIELAFWNSVKDSTEPRLYQEYLSKYPDGQFASLAKTKIEILSKQPAAKTSPKEPPATPSKISDFAQQATREVAFWNSVKDKSDPELFQDYLNRFPNGLFAPIARLKLAATEKAESAKEQEQQQDESKPNFRRKLAPLRPVVPLSDYTGPSEGEIHWTGRVLKNGGFIIQGGQANTGAITGDLPRVPVKIQIVGDQAGIIQAPNPKNQSEITRADR
jgi:serine/threonine-protein kinase